MAGDPALGAGPRPPSRSKNDFRAGDTPSLDPTTDHGEESYVGKSLFAECAVVVTGGDSGIGRAVAIAFAREGADIVISYLDEHEDARESAKWVERAGRRAVLLPGDVSDESHCEMIVGTALEQFGRIDVLVNNAGFQRTHKRLEEVLRAGDPAHLCRQHCEYVLPLEGRRKTYASR